ncbi:MAG: heme-binding protein, partial [Clostridia bacterium]
MEEKMLEHVVEAVTRACKQQNMTLALARRLIARVERRAREMGVQVVVAVSNAAGHPVAVACMDDAYIASFDIALQKAFTVAALKMSTAQLKILAQPGGALYGIEQTNGGRIVIFGGGEPLLHAGRLIGGLGVSGGNEAQD